MIATAEQVQEFLTDVELLDSITQVLQYEPLQLHELAEIVDIDISLLYDPIATLMNAGIVGRITTCNGFGYYGSESVNFYFSGQS